MFILLRTLCQLFFYAAFIGFSFTSVKDFIEGKSVFEIFNEKVEDLRFPDLTFCPRQNRSLAYLKIIDLKRDLNLSSSEIDSYKIFRILNSSLVDDYSFVLEESILKTSIM